MHKIFFRKMNEKWKTFFFLALIFAISSCYYYPQEQMVTRPSPDENIRAITQIYFYPNRNQSADLQSRDHYACYTWAMEQTGFDPSESSIVPEQRVRVVPMPPPGQDTIAMSIAGAVLGALIAGPRHAGGGALIGAAGGAMAGMVSDASRVEAARQMEEAYNNRNQGRDFRREKKACSFGGPCPPAWKVADIR